MDQPISQKEQSKGTVKRFIPFVLIAGVLALSYYGFRVLLKKQAEKSKLHVVRVERGAIRQTLSASGTVIASAERVINAPVSTEIESVLLSTGREVNEGDLILKLDQEFTSLEYERLQDELSVRKNDIDRLKLEFDKKLRDLEYQNQIKGLELKELSAQVKDQKRLLEIGGATTEEVESAELKLNITQLEKKMLENELEFKQQVNTTDKDNLQLQYNIQLKKLRELKRKLRETEVRSPERGVITWINENIGKTVSEGEPLVRIANLDRFKVEAVTSDRNGKDLAVGLPVEVRIGKDRLKGQISRILPEIINNTVKFFITLDNESHEGLRPNLRAEVYIIIDEKSDVLRAKRGNGLKGTQQQFVYRIEDNEAIKTRIMKGLTSTEYFEIVEGLKEGDQIIISETKDFDHMDRFIIQD